MKITFRKMENTDRNAVLEMMRVFYRSAAVYTDGNEEIFSSDFENSVSGSPYLEGYIITADDCVAGYTMLAKSFSTEFGKECIWLEDLYLKENYRNKGIIPEFIDFVKNKYPDKLLRIEVEKENSHAVYVYEKCRFKKLPYYEYYY